MLQSLRRGQIPSFVRMVGQLYEIATVSRARRSHHVAPAGRRVTWALRSRSDDLTRGDRRRSLPRGAH